MRFNRHLGTFAVAGLLLGGIGTAHAQDSTTGAVRGQVRDQADKEPVIGATVVASGPALQGTQASITDETGQYSIANLPPGTYEVVVYFADAKFSRTNVLIQLGKVAKVNIGIDTKATAGETIVIEGRAPLIDQQSTKVGNTVTHDYTDNIPTGRTFGAVLGAAGGSQNDFYGTSVGGSTSVENTYIVEGVNTTDPGFGLLSTNLPNEFVQETEIITGGYNAEYGRSTGGVINVITKSGSNQFHGSVFGYWTPGGLVADERVTPRAGNSIDREDNLNNRFDFGAEVGGPIVKDRLWFHAGINPSFISNEVSRIVKRQVDEDNDGVPDVDQNGFTVLEELDRNRLTESFRTVYYSGKLTGAVTPDHQGSISVMGSPSRNDDFCIGGAPCTPIGQKSATREVINRNVFDMSAKWTSKFFDNKTQVDAVAGFHGDKVDQEPALESGFNNGIRYETERSLAFFDQQEAEYGGVPAGCQDGAGDPFPEITNCPVPLYRAGGLAFVEDTNATRISGLLSATQRVQLLGHHVIKGGADIENQGFEDGRYYTGGAWYRERASQQWNVRRFLTPDVEGVPCGADIDGDRNGDANCRAIEEGEVLNADTRTRNLGAYLQDSWSVLPNLTLNAGVRWEQQTLFSAEHLRGQISPTTGEPIPREAFTLGNMVAPRLGVVYDWTQEGRSKVYGHFGRFYESIPMDINVRAYGGEVIGIDVYNNPGCDAANPVGSCAMDGPDFIRTDFSGAGDTLVSPGMRAQYLDEIVLGTEYEILPDLKIGASYIRRDLGRVIEDVSTDGANTYIIANPGEVDTGAVADLRREAAQIMESDPGRAQFLNYEADTFEGVGIFDKPKRTYNAIQLTAERRFTNSFYMAATYTYSELRGNFPGLFSPETQQLDPNLTSMYDLPELMANRYGDLRHDRPHLVKLDGFYRLPLEEIGFFTFGASVRGTSGEPINTLGAHPSYGLGESYILPRGAGGRTGLTTRFDTHVAYGRALSGGMRMEAFVDIFNLFNQQPEIEVDENYTYEDVNPIVGGDQADLEHLKAYGTNRRPAINSNYKNTFDRQDPLSARFGLRLLF
ncbi:MAG TPA: TonB-dependent receptor [Kofleriaceae bacterium]|nr:TonB-dependent receptor [Kofleriaceae bacterium]